MTSAPDQDRAPIELPHRVRLEILGAVLLGIFLAALDQTIVGTALPVIVTELNGNEFYVWAFTAYLVTSTISGPIYGKLSDLYGRRPLFIIGILIFLLGSILSGLSQEMWQLIAFRGLQGLGAGALFPIALAIIADIFAPSERGKYQGFFGAVFGLSFLLGPSARRPDHRQLRLAVDLLHQRAAWRGGAADHPAHAANRSRSEC